MKKLEIFLALSLFSAITASLIYTFHTKSFKDYAYIALFIGAIFTFLVGTTIKPRKRSQVDTEEDYDEEVFRFQHFLFLAIPLILFSGVFYYSILISIIDTFKYLYALSSTNLRIVLPALLTITIGYFLFLFRCHYRVAYGLSEIIVGVLAGVLHTINLVEFDKPELYLTVLSASIYLIVRGFDNMSIGMKGKSDMLLLNKILGLTPWNRSK